MKITKEIKINKFNFLQRKPELNALIFQSVGVFDILKKHYTEKEIIDYFVSNNIYNFADVNLYLFLKERTNKSLFFYPNLIVENIPYGGLLVLDKLKISLEQVFYLIREEKSYVNDCFYMCMFDKYFKHTPVKLNKTDFAILNKLGSYDIKVEISEEIFKKLKNKYIKFVYFRLGYPIKTTQDCDILIERKYFDISLKIEDVSLIDYIITKCNSKPEYKKMLNKIPSRSFYEDNSNRA